MSTIRLVKPSDTTLIGVFARHLAGWAKHEVIQGYRDDPYGAPIPDFLSSVDAVLPYLEGFAVTKTEYIKISVQHAWRVDLFASLEDHEPAGYASDQSLARAAVIALLRSEGIEIEC